MDSGRIAVAAAEPDDKLFKVSPLKKKESSAVRLSPMGKLRSELSNSKEIKAPNIVHAKEESKLKKEHSIVLEDDDEGEKISSRQQLRNLHSSQNLDESEEEPIDTEKYGRGRRSQRKAETIAQQVKAEAEPKEVVDTESYGRGLRRRPSIQKQMSNEVKGAKIEVEAVDAMAIDPAAYGRGMRRRPSLQTQSSAEVNDAKVLAPGREEEEEEDSDFDDEESHSSNEGSGDGLDSDELAGLEDDMNDDEKKAAAASSSRATRGGNKRKKSVDTTTVKLDKATEGGDANIRRSRRQLEREEGELKKALELKKLDEAEIPTARRDKLTGVVMKPFLEAGKSTGKLRLKPRHLKFSSDLGTVGTLPPFILVDLYLLIFSTEIPYKVIEHVVFHPNRGSPVSLIQVFLRKEVVFIEGKPKVQSFIFWTESMRKSDDRALVTPIYSPLSILTKYLTILLFHEG